MACDGTYKVVTTTPMGPKVDMLEVKTEGTALTGTFAGSPLVEGVINGDEISFHAAVKGPLGKMDAVISAKIEGDKFTGSSKTKMGTFPVAGEKA